MVTVPIVFLDTETTGVHPDRQVWEVAMIRRWSDSSQRETSFFVEVNLAEADPFGLNVGRFWERHPLGREITQGIHTSEHPYSRADAARKIATWTHGAHIVGAVPNFDTETLAPLLREHGLIPAWHYHLIDVESLAIGWLAGRRHRQNEIVDGYPLENNGEPAPGLVRWNDHPKAVALPWNSDDLTRAIGVEPAADEDRHTALGDAKWAMRIYDAVMTP